MNAQTKKGSRWRLEDWPSVPRDQQARTVEMANDDNRHSRREDTELPVSSQ